MATSGLATPLPPSSVSLRDCLPPRSQLRPFPNPSRNNFTTRALTLKGNLRRARCEIIVVAAASSSGDVVVETSENNITTKKQFEACRDSLESTAPTITKLRAYAERIRLAELDKCLAKMRDDDDGRRAAVDELSREIVNQLLHGPMQHLRCDGSSAGRCLRETLENVHALNRVFSLETEGVDRRLGTKGSSKKQARST